jgi:uncharacterized protein with von Willebrand factor type A (vWA) domain
MASIVAALDNYTPIQLGENGHAEFGWSNNIQENILQFSFQVIRCSDSSLKRLESQLIHMLTILKEKQKSGILEEKNMAKHQLSILFRMIGHTRDVIDGKGERTVSYMMIDVWHTFYPALAEFAMKCFFSFDDFTTHPYGSWKDVKYLCKYLKDNNKHVNSPLIASCVRLINAQLKLDSVSETNISLAAKWAPREQSMFGWLYNDLAYHYFSEFISTAKGGSESQRKAQLKCKTAYRKLLSSLNRKIDTTQIHQCEQDWKSIDFSKVTSVTLSKQKKAFLNITKKDQVRYKDNKDREECALHFTEHIQAAKEGKGEVKGKRISMEHFTEQAMQQLSEVEIDLLNSQWRDNSSQTGNLGNCIAMVDVSGSMSGDPLHVAIALGIRIAEKSSIGKRVLTFSSTPQWFNLEPYPDFVTQVNQLRRADWGNHTNFTAALDMILHAIVEKKLPRNEVENMVLIILSDMQMDAGDRVNRTTLYKTMTQKYSDAGIKVNGEPYNPPHILFWNLRSTTGFPNLSTEPNTSMMSGFSPALLNMFCDKGVECLKEYTPYSMLVKSLDNERYAILHEFLQNTIV